MKSISILSVTTVFEELQLLSDVQIWNAQNQTFNIRNRPDVEIQFDSKNEYRKMKGNVFFLLIKIDI